MTWKFTPIDFLNFEHTNLSLMENAAIIANAKLEAWRQKATVVFTSEFDQVVWYKAIPTGFRRPTHRALLIDIEPIEKKPCEHRVPDYHAEYVDKELRVTHVTCKHCGVKLKATWEAAE